MRKSNHKLRVDFCYAIIRIMNNETNKVPLGLRFVDLLIALFVLIPSLGIIIGVPSSLTCSGLLSESCLFVFQPFQVITVIVMTFSVGLFAEAGLIGLFILFIFLLFCAFLIYWSVRIRMKRQNTIGISENIWKSFPLIAIYLLIVAIGTMIIFYKLIF